MSEELRGVKTKLNISLIFSAISSCSIAFIPIFLKNESVEKLGYLLIPGVFWLGTILEQVFFWLGNKQRKEVEKEDKSRKNIRKRIGIIAFFQTKLGMISDIAFLLVAVSFVICIIFGLGEEYLQFILISCLILTFRMHCIFNGMNFRYIQNTKKRRVERDV